MGAISDYLENAILNATLHGVPYVPSNNLFLALFLSNPTDSGTGTEVSSGGYVRQPISFGAAANGATSNTADVTYPVATGPWGTIGWFGIYDAQTNGNMLYYGSLGASRIVDSGDQLRVSAGNLTVSID